MQNSLPKLKTRDQLNLPRNPASNLQGSSSTAIDTSAGGISSPTFPGLGGNVRGGPQHIKFSQKNARNLNMAMNKSGFSMQRRHKTPLLTVPKNQPIKITSRANQSNMSGWSSRMQDVQSQGQQHITKQKIQDLMIPVLAKTGSRIFGDKVEDFQELANQLGGIKLNRMRANELNIYCRGSVKGVQAHLNILKSSTNIHGQEVNQSLNIMDCLVGLQNKTSAIGADQEQIFKKPNIDLQRLADWLNQNFYFIQSTNHLQSKRNSFYSQHGSRKSHGNFGRNQALMSRVSQNRWGNNTQLNQQSGPDLHGGRSNMMTSQHSVGFSQDESDYNNRAKSQLTNIDPVRKMMLDSHIQKTLKIMRDDKKVYDQVRSTLSLYEQDRIKISLEDGVKATQDAQRRVRERKIRMEEKEEQGIEDLIKKQQGAINATNLERLLTKKWSEHPNAYHIMTKIQKFSKNEDRVNELLCQNRYSP